LSLLPYTSHLKISIFGTNIHFLVKIYNGPTFSLLLCPDPPSEKSFRHLGFPWTCEDSPSSLQGSAWTVEAYIAHRAQLGPTAGHHGDRGLVLIRKQYLPPPPFSKNDNYSLSRHFIFSFLLCPFCLIVPYFAYILLFYFPFSLFYPLFLPSFLLLLCPLSLPCFIFFPQMTSADISTLPGGGGRGYFPIYRTLLEL
jgi:hypothetical protein